MGQNGGARPGAGRKPKAEKFKQPVAKAEKRIADRLPELIDLQFELAQGVWIEETTPLGHRKVYKRAPDREAGQYLINRIMGKPTERQEISGPQGRPIEFNWDATVTEIEAGSDADPETPGTNEDS